MLSVELSQVELGLGFDNIRLDLTLFVVTFSGIWLGGFKLVVLGWGDKKYKIALKILFSRCMLLFS